MNILYCRVTGRVINGTFISKNESNFGTAYLNIQDKNGKYFQIHGKSSQEHVTGGEYVYMDTISLRDEVSYTINKLSGKMVFLGETIESTENIKECNFGSNKMKELPKIYSIQESAFIVGIGMFLFLCFYVIFRKYFVIFMKKKHIFSK